MILDKLKNKSSCLKVKKITLKQLYLLILSEDELEILGNTLTVFIMIVK